MYLFAAYTAGRERDTVSQREVAYALLSYAVRRIWKRPVPEIVRDKNGKPRFADVDNMHFSLSHTRTCVLVGVSGLELGVDAESVRPLKAGLEERLFSPEMRADFTFFEGWTLRESVYKLTGRGSLRNMEFSRCGQEISAPFEGVKCRLYSNIDGCVAAASCFSGNLPEKIEIVDMTEFMP